MAMFGSLTDRLTETFKHLRSKGKLSPADVDATVREIRRALLEATVDAHVTDTTKSGPGVAGVTVDLVGPSGTLHGTTDSTGSVLFPGLQPTASGETYRIEVTSAPAGWRYDPAAQMASDSSGPVLATQTQRFTLVLTRTTP